MGVIAESKGTKKKKNLLEISFEKNLVNKNTDSIKEKPNS